MRVKSAAITVLLSVLLVAAVTIGPAASPPGVASDVECGPQSLFAICQKLGVEVTVDELSALSGLDAKTGTTMLGLAKAAEAKGLHARGMKISVDELTRSGIPAIALLWDNHFVTTASDAEGLHVTDHTAGTQVIPVDVFASKYSGFALLIAQDESLFPISQANGPDLRFATYNYDFGVIEQGAQAGHAFTYENRGNQELVISKVDVSCSCTQTSFKEEKRVPPGGKGELVVGYDSTGREGGQAQTVYVYSNDPISPVVQLQMKGVVKPIHLSVSARSVDFGIVKKRAGATQEFSINVPGDGSLKVKEVTSGSKYVKTSVTQAQGKYLVKAVLLPGAPIGPFKSALKVSTNFTREPSVEIPVTAEVIGDVDMFPHQFFMGMLKAGQNSSKTLTLSTTADEPLTIEKIDNPCEWVIVKAVPDAPGKSYKITATLKGTAPLGLTKEIVVVHTNDEDQPRIEIPLYALIEN